MTRQQASRCWSWFGVLAVAAAVAAACGGEAIERPLVGFSASAAAAEFAAEATLASVIDPASVDEHFRELTRLPHPAGSERTREIAEMIRDRFQEYGLDEVRLHRYDVLLPMPREVTVQMLEPVTYTPSLREDPYPIDPDTAQDPGPTYLGMSASGEVTAPLIYAHSGNPEDYDWLESQGIDPAGKIVIVRYSVPYSYRGFKAWEAQRRGVKAMLVYSDPKEDGFLKGEVFPDGPWGPESHIQRGAITYDFIVPGDPLTPGWPSVEGAERIPVQEARSVPEIMAVPMSWRDAQPLLENLGGPEVPESWRGGLPITYRAGGAGSVVRVKVDMDDGVRPIWVVEGRILGSEHPEQLVVLGNHHDAWVYGGVDPSSGTATMLELARGLGEMVRQGHRPKRTIVLGAWDAEEWHLTGSTEWGEQFADELSEHAVAYLNVDSSTSGSNFNASGVASLNRLVIQTARDVADPGGEGSVLDAWRAANETGHTTTAAGAPSGVVATDDLDLIANSLGSGSDYTVFLNHLGVPVVSMSFDGPYGVYHSMYDNYYRMTELVDPGLQYMTAMAELWGRMALRLANAEVLPYDFELYADRVDGFLDAIAQREDAAGLDLEAARDRVEQWRAAGAELDRRVAAALEATVDGDDLRDVNAVLVQVERQLLLLARGGDSPAMAEGIPGRPWFRHALYAPRYTYAAMSLPGVTEALEAGDSVLVAQELQRLTDALERTVAMTREAIALLPES